MANSIDLDSWRSALADQQTVEAAQNRFAQQRFTMGERERHAAGESVRFQADQVRERLQPLRAEADKRKRVLETRLAELVDQREQLQLRAANGQGSPARINRTNRALQTRISGCAIQLNALAKLIGAQRPEDLDTFTEEELACLSLAVDIPAWTGTAARALPNTMAAAGALAALATALPWFGQGWGAVWFGIAGENTSVAASILGYVAIIIPVVFIVVSLTSLRLRRWLTISAALALVFAWTGLCYARFTASVPWWSFGDLFGHMQPGGWLYAIAAFTGLVAACYYAQGEGNTMQRSLRTAAWLVVLFAIPGLATAGVLAFRPSPPVIGVELSAVADEFDLLSLSITNNSEESIELSLPWSPETSYGVRVEMMVGGDESFQGVDETGGCWRAPLDRERLMNRLTVPPGISETAWFDIACFRGIGYAPERLRFSLTDADGQTLKAYQAIIPE